MKKLIDAMEVKEEEMQSQFNAMGTNQILIKSEVRNLTEQNENYRTAKQLYHHCREIFTPANRN